jgi:peptidoglycan-N-acetylglucosamine deacetylase
MTLSDRLITCYLSKFLPASLLWRVKTKERAVYLTFDDGPIPGLTDEILKILKEFEAKATFFCVGENVMRNPDLYREITRAGHVVGNHSHHHVKGWKTNLDQYLDDVEEASRYVDSRLYRPPYGLVTWKQARALSKKYQVVMWSVLTKDYDPLITPEQCLEIAVKGVKPGAIIVFHDNTKARDKVLYALPRLLEYLKREGFECRVLSSEF